MKKLNVSLSCASYSDLHLEKFSILGVLFLDQGPPKMLLNMAFAVLQNTLWLTEIKYTLNAWEPAVCLVSYITKEMNVIQATPLMSSCLVGTHQQITAVQEERHVL